jgi:hypothetical protein
MAFLASDGAPDTRLKNLLVKTETLGTACPIAGVKNNISSFLEKSRKKMSMCGRGQRGERKRLSHRLHT